jgi:hypothetical protein
MGLGGILILLLLIVSLVAFIYLIVVTAKGWGALHTTLLCFLFIECWVFIVFAAGVQNRRVRYTKEAALAERQALQAAEQTQKLLYGSGFDLQSENLDAVVPVRGMVRRLVAARGRVWRQLAFVQESNGSYQLEFMAPATPANADDALGGMADTPQAGRRVSDAESLPRELVVYAFASDVDERGLPFPIFYLGEYRVARNQAGQVTLDPTLPLLPQQRQYIASGEASTWMLYELMPVDGHEVFAAPGSSPSDSEIFGHMEREQFEELFANVPNENGLRDRLIDSYARDGAPTDDQTELASLWVQINILSPVTVDVDSRDTTNATVGGYFDTIGRSVDERLKRGESPTVELTPEMNSKRIIVKEEVAQELIAAGKAELVQRLYVRPLRDYEDAFNHYVVQAAELNDRIAIVKRNSSEIEAANQLGNEMITRRQVENQRLTADLEGIQKELAVLNQLATSADGELAGLKGQMSNLYRTIIARRNQMQ